MEYTDDLIKKNLSNKRYTEIYKKNWNWNVFQLNDEHKIQYKQTSTAQTKK